MDTKVLKPQRGEKKQLVNLAIKNARVSLEQKFNLLEKSVEKTQGAIENLGRLLQIPTQSVSSLLITLILWGLVQSLLWLFLLTGNQAKKITASIKSRLWSDQMTMQVCERLFVDVYGRVQRDGLTPPDLIVIDGGQGQVNIAKQVIQEELG